MTILRWTIQRLLFCVVMVVLLQRCEGQSRNDSLRLMDDMLREYDRRIRPVLNQSDAVNVNISFSIVSLPDFDEVGGTFSVVLILYINWIDEVIRWDPASYGGKTSLIYNVQDVWYPMIVLASSSENFRDLAEDWMTLRIYHTGMAVFSLGLLSKSTCDVNVMYFPFDRQTCRVMLMSWLESQQEVSLNAPVPFADGSLYVENGEWSMIRNTTSKTVLEQRTMLNLEVILERKPLFAVINTMLPIILMSVLNVMVFVLPAESGERGSFAITVLLALAVFLTLVADSLPSTSEPMSILAFFLMTSLFISAFICIAVILNLRVYYMVCSQPVSPWQRRIVHLLRNKTKERQFNISNDASVEGHVNTTDDLEEEMSWQTVAVAIDKLLLFVFSSTSIINIVLFLMILAANRFTHNIEQ